MWLVRDGNLGEDCLNHASRISGLGRCVGVDAIVVREPRRGAGLEGVRAGQR